MTVTEYVQGLAKVTSSLVGDKLSLAGKGSNAIPSVFVGRQKPSKPFYPYSICDYIGKGKYGSKALHRSFNEDTNTSDTYFNRRLRLRVAFYGKYGDNILDTIEELEMLLRTDKGKRVMKLYMPCAGLMTISEPDYRDDLLTTDYEEFVAITIDFWVISKVSDFNFYEIRSGKVEGELYHDDPEEENTLTITAEFEHEEQET